MVKEKNDFEKHKEIIRGSARVKYLKEDRKGVDEMCEAVERYARERAKKAEKKAAREHAARLFQNGVSFDVVLNSITGLGRKELERIYRKSAAV